MEENKNIILFNTVFQETPKKEDFFSFKFTDITATLAIIISSVALFMTVRQYIESKKWKKIEFIAKEIQSFNEDSNIRKALTMIDWDEKSLEFFPDKDDYDEKFLIFTNLNIVTALNIDFKFKSNMQSQDSELNSKIRDIFDHFFDRLVNFSQYLQAKVFEYKDIKPYLEYWIEQLFNTEKSYKKIDIKFNDGISDKKVNLQKHIWSYLHYFDYHHVLELSKELDKKIDIKNLIDKYIDKIKEISINNSIKEEKYIKHFALRNYSLSLDISKIDPIFKSYLSDPSKKALPDEKKLKEITELLKKESLKY